ncbi:hypothetical protein PybrP1_001010 [[Pythium] brassicae (nom. inval.)]|nr:hypothetical protein PybrP1_001010 [[Pythium] brassicae (nom. inval.)]
MLGALSCVDLRELAALEFASATLREPRDEAHEDHDDEEREAAVAHELEARARAVLGTLVGLADLRQRFAHVLLRLLRVLLDLHCSDTHTHTHTIATVNTTVESRLCLARTGSLRTDVPTTSPWSWMSPSISWKAALTSRSWWLMWMMSSSLRARSAPARHRHEQSHRHTQRPPRRTVLVVRDDVRLRVDLVLVVVGELGLGLLLVVVERVRRAADELDRLLFRFDELAARLLERAQLVLKVRRELGDLRLAHALADARLVELLEAPVDLRHELVALVREFAQCLVVRARVLRRVEERHLLRHRARELVEARDALGRLLDELLEALV